MKAPKKVVDVFYAILDRYLNGDGKTAVQLYKKLDELQQAQFWYWATYWEAKYADLAKKFFNYLEVHIKKVR